MYNGMKVDDCDTIYTIVQNPDDNSLYKLTWESSEGNGTRETQYDYTPDCIKLALLDRGGWKVVQEATKQSPLSTRKDGKVLMDLFDEGFPNAVLEISRVMTWAAENKGYKPHDWVNLPSAETSFPAAASRHRLASLVQKVSGCEVSKRVDDESKILHKAHEAFNVLAELELMLRGIIK